MRSAVRFMMLLMICLSLISQTAKSSEFKRSNKDLEKLISILNPKLPNSEIKSIASGLTALARDNSCEVPLLVVLSIAYKESGLDRHAYNQDTKDHGIMQINEKTIQRLQIDKKRLTKDVYYSFKVGCYLLTENKQKYSKRRPYWLGIYNAGTRLTDSRIVDKAKKYDISLKKIIKMVEKKSQEITTIVPVKYK